MSNFHKVFRNNGKRKHNLMHFVQLCHLLEDVLLALGILPPEEEDQLAVAHEQRRVVSVLLCKKERV